tara:strand:- start:1195 stop:2475 length:1281 start_codon:yes stop_codon:yes gene_type:complete
MLKSLFNKVYKPENPIDLDILTKLPREKYNIFDRLKVFFIALRSKDKNSIYFFLSIIKNILIKIFLIIFFPLIIILKYTKFRFVIVNYWQIGAYFRQVSNLYKEQKLNSCKKKFLIYAPKKFVINYEINKIFKKDFIFIENIFLCSILYIFFHSELIRYKILNLDEHDISSKSYYLNFLFKKKNLKINYIDKEQEKFFFEKFKKEFFDLKKNDKIISMHVRDKSYYNDNSFRNANIETYFKSINYLLSKDYKIFHFGNKVQKKLSSHKNYYHIDTTDDKYRDLQLYIIKKSKFFIGTNSGPYTIANELDVPVLLTNLFPFHGIYSYNKNDVTLPKKLIVDGQKVKYEEIFNDYFQKYLIYSNRRVLDNTDDEILEGVKEILNNLDSKHEIDVMEKRKNLSNTLSPNKYAFGKISESYIEKNKDYFN